ncbi:homeobox protein Nkx-3.2, partial [Clarias magur]
MRAMAVRSSSLIPFSIQAILNRKVEEEEDEEKGDDGRRRLKELDVCFSKSACWKIFGGAHEDDAREDRERETARVATSHHHHHHKSYDSDSGLSEDHQHDQHQDGEGKSGSGREHERHDDCDSRALDESFQDETDRDSTAAEQARELSDCELLASVS